MKKAASMGVMLLVMMMAALPQATYALIPYTTRSNIFDMILPINDVDPFRILEQTPLAIPRAGVETLALARVEWKETSKAHIISLDVPGINKEDIKIQVEENRVLRISGERKVNEEKEGDKWHRAERTSGKFWRQFRLPSNVDLDSINAHLEHGVLKITIPKMAEEKKRQPEVVNIATQAFSDGEDVKTTSKAADIISVL